MSPFTLDPFLLVVLFYLTEQCKVERFVWVHGFSSSWHGKCTNMSGVGSSDFLSTWPKLQSSGKRKSQLKKKKLSSYGLVYIPLKKWLMWEDPAHSEWCRSWAGGPMFSNQVVRTSHVKQASKHHSSMVLVWSSFSLQVPAQLDFPPWLPAMIDSD